MSAGLGIGALFGTLAVMFGGVALGALIVVIPTGALVSSTAAVVVTTRAPLESVLVVLVAAGAALLGDSVVFWLMRRGSRPVRKLLRDHTDSDHLEPLRRRLVARPIPVLVLSRLIPGGRVPVLVVSALARQSLHWFARGDAFAVLAWALLYSAIGVLGGALFDHTWQAVLLAVGLVIAFTGVAALVRKVRAAH